MWKYVFFPSIFKENTNILISPAETQGNPDIGYIWVFIDFSDSLDLLDEKKNHICPSQVLSNLFYGTFMKSGSRVKFIKGNMVEKKVKTLRFFSFANFHPENHPIEKKCHNQS